MNKALIIGFISLVLFIVSASASWYVQALKMPQANASAGAEKVRPSTSSSTTRRPEASLPGAALSEAEPERTAARPPYVAGTDRAINLASSLRDRLGAVRDKEAQLDARQQRLELVYQDIKGERAALDELRKQVSDELKAVEDKMAAVEHKKVESEQKVLDKTAELTALEKKRVELADVEQNNVKRMAEMYDNMDADSAARILQQLADSAKLDTAVKVLGLMKERQAAKVLAAMPPDSGLAAQLLERLKGLDRSHDKAKK
jgi:flagellar motility protein MotE (MotC chaperone)